MEDLSRYLFNLKFCEEQKYIDQLSNMFPNKLLTVMEISQYYLQRVGERLYNEHVVKGN